LAFGFSLLAFALPGTEFHEARVSRVFCQVVILEAAPAEPHLLSTNSFSGQKAVFDVYGRCGLLELYAMCLFCGGQTAAQN
jgi:hypothetical protein